MTINIENLKKLILSEELLQKNLFINEINEKIDLFYLFLINYYANKYNFLTTVNSSKTNNLKSIQDELFMSKKLFIFRNIFKKDIDLLTENNDKKIFFVDYKNFKYFKAGNLNINAYSYQHDLRFFLEKELNILNENLINFLITNPEYTYSEISKAQINGIEKNYMISFAEDTSITSIRKNIFNSKKEGNIDIKKIYFFIKKEVDLKKTNFLTY